MYLQKNISRALSPSDHYQGFPSTSRGAYRSSFQSMGHFGSSNRGNLDQRSLSYSPSRDGRSFSSDKMPSPVVPRRPSGNMYGHHLSKEEGLDREETYLRYYFKINS